MKKIYSLIALAITSFGFAQTYELVTNQSQIVNNGQYIFAGVKNGNLQLLGAQGNNNRSAVATTIAATNIPTSLTQSELSSYTFTTLTFVNSASNIWFIKDGSSYLYAAGTGSNNYLRTSENTEGSLINDDREKWSITITNNILDIQSITTATTRKVIRYNNSNSSNLFSCYASGQNDVIIYKLVEEETPVEPVAPTAVFSATSLPAFTYAYNEGPSATQTVDVTIADLAEGQTATLTLDTTDFTIVSPTSTVGNGTHTITLQLAAGLEIGAYEAHVAVMNGTTEVGTGLDITGNVTEPALGNTKNEIEGLRIFPNPANDIVTISSNTMAVKSVQLFDVTGKQIMNVETSSSINVSSLTKGIYVMKITEEGKTSTSKLIIK